MLQLQGGIKIMFIQYVGKSNYLFLEPQHFLYFFFDPQAHRSLRVRVGFCFFLDLRVFSSVVFFLSLLGSSFVSPVEGSNSTNLLCSALCSFQCAR